MKGVVFTTDGNLMPDEIKKIKDKATAASCDDCRR